MNSELLLIILTTTIVLSFLVCSLIIYIQKKKQLGQIERELGPRSHKFKINTPTMGGVAFILISTIATIVVKKILMLEVDLVLILFPFISYALLGLIDDLLIVKFKNNDGINAKAKMIIQVAIATIYFIILLINDSSTSIFILSYEINIKWIYGIFILFMFSLFTNATNITDGVDGLLGGTSVISLFGFYLLSLYINHEISIIILIIMASLCGFLFLNYPKASIFMGNVGAYGIGALLVTISICLKLEFYLFVIGGIYLLETLSVIIQVSYFKKTNGKRIFKMAPLHHHFELSGFSEKEVIYMFYTIELIFVYASIIMFLLSGGLL